MSRLRLRKGSFSVAYVSSLQRCWSQFCFILMKWNFLSFYLILLAMQNSSECCIQQQIQVVRKSLRDFRPLRFSSRDGHAEGEHVNRGRDTPIFSPTLKVLDMSTLVDAVDVNPVIKFLPHTHKCGRNLITVLTSAASPRVDILSTCNVGQKLEVSLPLLTCSPSA